MKAIPSDISPRITIDVHAHILPEATIRRLAGESPRVAPKLIDANGSTIMEINGKVVQNPMPREAFDLDLRLRDMDRHGVAMQLLAATVHTFFYHEEPALAAACAAVQNDEIARDRRIVIATASWGWRPCRCRTRGAPPTSSPAPRHRSDCAARRSDRT